MAGSSRMDRFVKLVGGEENLPPKIVEKEAVDAAKTSAEASPDTQPKKPEEEWWNAEPQLPSQNPPSHPAAEPSTSLHDIGHFDFDPRRGQPAPLGITFSPFAAVTKFCYLFVSDDLRQPLATAFFDAGKIFMREWDLYYIWSDYCMTTKPILFISEDQLQTLLDDINNHFADARISITDQMREEGLVLDFDIFKHPDLRPRVLGHSTSRDQIDDWTNRLPIPQDADMSKVEDRSLEAFKAKMQLAQDAAKAKKKRKMQQRQIANIARREDMRRMVTRAQRYLGLHPTTQTSQDMPDMFSLSLDTVEVTNIPPYPFDQDVVFIAVDVEAYERPPRQVTEIGLATLDTRDLKTKAPGPAGSEWRSAIRARHLRVAEYFHLRNHEFVQGCPDKFEFGKSEVTGKDKLPSKIASAFKQPFSGPEDPNTAEEKRNIILVGHDISADITYLQQIGYNLANLSNILDTLDTAEMYRVHTQDPNPRSLGSILYDFDISGWHLHNAGNDAVYTLQAMMAICVAGATERSSAEAKGKIEMMKEERTLEAVEAAKERVNADMEGWDVTDDQDGGVPIPVGGLLNGKPVYGPPRPGERQYYTMGGALLDI